LTNRFNPQNQNESHSDSNNTGSKLKQTKTMIDGNTNSSLIDTTKDRRRTVMKKIMTNIRMKIDKE